MTDRNRKLAEWLNGEEYCGCEPSEVQHAMGHGEWCFNCNKPYPTNYEKSQDACMELVEKAKDGAFWIEWNPQHGDWRAVFLGTRGETNTRARGVTPSLAICAAIEKLIDAEGR